MKYFKTLLSVLLLKAHEVIAEFTNDSCKQSISYAHSMREKGVDVVCGVAHTPSDCIDLAGLH